MRPGLLSRMHPIALFLIFALSSSSIGQSDDAVLSRIERSEQAGRGISSADSAALLNIATNRTSSTQHRAIMLLIIASRTHRDLQPKILYILKTALPAAGEYGAMLVGIELQQLLQLGYPDNAERRSAWHKAWSLRGPRTSLNTAERTFISKWLRRKSAADRVTCAPLIITKRNLDATSLAFLRSELAHAMKMAGSKEQGLWSFLLQSVASPPPD